MERKALARRYRYLWMGEATNILIIIVVFLYYALMDGKWSNWIARTYSLTIVIIILLQGVIWWRWKLRVLHAGQRTMPLRILIRFRRFRWVNWLLIGLFPVVLWLKWWLTDSFRTHRRLRRGSIGKALAQMSE
jgi:hypothetical protein